MDSHFERQDWRPTALPEMNAYEISEDELVLLIDLLTMQTRAIQAHPYDPESWLRRAGILRSLGYPELAHGDGYKALLLAHRKIKGLPAKLVSESSAPGAIDSRQQEQLCCIYQHMQSEGEYAPRPYPWLRTRHRRREDKVLETLNKDMRDASQVDLPHVNCEVRRNAFGPGVGADDGNELWGVFALRGMRKDEIVINDVSKLPARRSVPKRGSRGIAYWTDRDLSWIKEKLTLTNLTIASELCLRARFLQLNQLDGVDHPLDHPLMARLVATYVPSDRRKLETCAARIEILNEVLERLDIDIFANLNFDTWVLCTISDRIDTNAWDSGATCGLNTLFSMFNHSCEPNVDWQSDGINSIRMTANRDIQKGEQLLVTYDTYMLDATVESRQKTMVRWLGEPCICARCLREEAAGPLQAPSSDWDLVQRPDLPEDMLGPQ